MPHPINSGVGDVPSRYPHIAAHLTLSLPAAARLTTILILSLAACSGDKKASINDDLKNQLELASSSDGITLANSSPNAGQQVVSAIEQTSPPTRQQAPSAKVRHHKAAPKSPPQVVRTKAPATVAHDVLDMPGDARRVSSRG